MTDKDEQEQELDASTASNSRQFNEEKGGTDRDAAAAVKDSNDRQFDEEREGKEP